MKMLLVLWFVLVCAGPAEAAPVLTALGGVIASVTKAIAGSVLLQFIARTALSMGLSALARALAPKPRQPGITTETTTSGGTTPQKFPLGIYATGGQLVAPPMSYGSAGKTPRAYLVYVIALSAVPGIALSRVIINDDYAALGAPGASWGRPVTGDLADHAWVDFRDGTQSAAHADLLAAFGSDPDRPWTSDMIGPGVAYAVCRFKYNRELFNGLPAVRFEVTGIPLYDPREDVTVGGSGPQRWDNPATWAPSDNPVVMIYNILRGITLPDGEVWGGECAAEDLPFANWAAGMNECDLPVDDGDEGSEPQYRAGFEVAIEDEPAAVIEELLKTCSGQIAEMGGVWTIRVGAPGLSVLTISDDDILRSREQELDPFPGLADTWNGITATYPEPESLWEAKEAPARYSTEWEAADGGRRRTADLQLPACPWATQVQRLMASFIADERRFRRHRLTLPPEAAILGPLDTIAWTSVRNGYTTKLFEISGLTDSLMTMHQSIQIRERDADDFEVGPYLPAEPGQPGITRPVATSVPGWAVSPAILTDGAQDRRPALQIAWDPEGCEDATGIQWEVRLSGGTDAILTGTHGAISAGFLRIAEGVLAGTVYEARARLIVDRPVNWTAWTAVTAPAVLYGLVDLNGDKRQVIALGPLSFSSSVLVTLAMGPMEPGWIWKRGLVFEVRNPSGIAWTLILERRSKYAGVWAAWVELERWTVDGSAWAMEANSGTLSGAWEDFEYRLRTSGYKTDAIRNIYMTIVNVAK